jgi:hypothetical protein
MIKALEIIAKNPDKFDKLSQSKKELFISMAAKFCIKITLKADLEENANEIRIKEENVDLNNSIDEKTSFKEDSRLQDSNNKTEMPKKIEEEISEENMLLGYIEPKENLENNSNENINNIAHLNNSTSNQNHNNYTTINNKSNLSSIKEEKEVLSNSFKNSTEEVVYSANNEKKGIEQNINSFVNNQKEVNISSVNPSQNNQIKDNKEQHINGKHINNNFNNNTKNDSNDNTIKEKAILPANKPGKRLTIVDSKTQDDVDEKLDNYLINTYNKKKMSFIPMRRISENNYEFGSQKIEIKIDDEIIRGIFYIYLLFINYFKI